MLVCIWRSKRPDLVDAQQRQLEWRVGRLGSVIN